MQRNSGSTAHHPRYKLSFKWQSSSAVAKITGKEGLYFKGEAIVFENELDFLSSLYSHQIKENHVINCQQTTLFP